MKTTKKMILFVATLFVATFALSSCLNDDNETKVPTVEEQAGYQRTMAGTYGSTLRFFYPSFNNVVKYDSLKHYSWDVTADSTITMRNFPVCKLDSAIVISKDNHSDSAVEFAALRTAIHESNATAKLTAKYFVPNDKYFVEYGYSFPVFPMTIKQSFFYNGKSHDVYFMFDVSGTYGGKFLSSNFTDRVFEYNMVLSGICVDKYSVEGLISTQYFRQVLITCSTK